MIFICLIVNGCAINLRVDKPIQMENRYVVETTPQEIEIEKLANSFNDNRKYIFLSLVENPCFLGEDYRTWYNFLRQYGKDDIDGFIKWCMEGVLYPQSGGQFLSNYFKQVKSYYEAIDEK